jgi:hypothetical protein
MEPVSLVTTILTAMGYGAWVPVILAGIGFFSAVSTVYPATWVGAGVVKKMALVAGQAKIHP